MGHRVSDENVDRYVGVDSATQIIESRLLVSIPDAENM
jgi:hypothetical protein